MSLRDGIKKGFELFFTSVMVIVVLAMAVRHSEFKDNWMFVLVWIFFTGVMLDSVKNYFKN